VRHPLETIDWRLERAEQHLSTLDHEQATFFSRLEEKDRRITGHFDSDASEYVFSLNGDPPDPRIGLIVGEFGHNLRAALDNLLWQLVLLRGGSPTRKTQFPIYESRERYQSSLGMLRGISADDRALIEAYQPFQIGNGAPDAYLALLAWLSNVDKHRVLHIGGAFPRRFGIPVYFDSSESPPAGDFPWYAMPIRDVRKVLGARYVPTMASDDRTELMRVMIEPSGANPEMEMEGDPPIEIALSDPKHSLILDDLRVMWRQVVQIVEGFRPRFNI